MKISILIANYNNGHFFKDCYDSIINQTYNNWEVIILDDASTDNSVEVIKSIIGDDERFSLIQNDVNQGVGYTKKRCIEYAKGEWCIFLDPDDALTNDAVSELCSIVHNLENNKTVSGIAGCMYFCDDKLNINQAQSKGHLERLTRLRIQFKDNNLGLKYNIPIVVHHIFMFNRELYYMTPGMNPIFRLSEDHDLILKLEEVGEIVFLNKQLYLYRKHKKAISAIQTEKAIVLQWKAIFDAASRRNDNNDMIEYIFIQELLKPKEELRLLKKGVFSNVWRIYGKPTIKKFFKK
jgi:glycosyltransferase involved in cell wall biosynthesis